MPPGTLRRAVDALRRGDVVLYPTDTILGLAVRPDSEAALRRLFHLKARPEGAPVSVAFSSWEEVENVARLDPPRRRALRELLPGPYTLLLPARRKLLSRWPGGLFGPQGTVGVRIPDHPVARALARAAGPVTSTSANRHGEPTCRTVAEARRIFGDGVAVYLPADPPPRGVPSTLVDLSHSRPRVVLRRRP